jgi:hypothetical protein
MALAFASAPLTLVVGMGALVLPVVRTDILRDEIVFAPACSRANLLVPRSGRRGRANSVQLGCLALVLGDVVVEHGS